MRRFCFSLKQQFIVAALFAVLMWSVSRPSVASCASVVICWAIVASLTGPFANESPAVAGGLGGFASVAIFLAFYWPVYVCGYFFHDGPDEYFEDGVVTEVAIYPIVLLTVYGGAAFVIGAISGTIAGWAVRRARHRTA